MSGGTCRHLAVLHAGLAAACSIAGRAHGRFKVAYAVWAGAAEAHASAAYCSARAQAPADARRRAIQIQTARYNSLSGQLPEKLGNPKFIYLAQNALEGTIPAAWGTGMKSLEILNLE